MALRHRLGAMARRLGCSAALLGVMGLSAAASQQTPPTPATPTASASSLQPAIAKAQGGSCVGDPAFMRRNHMSLLKHQRDDTLRGGLRSGAFSLKQCVSCHASPVSHSVTAQPGDFCRSCHTYAAVRIDCFECHANQPSPLAQPAGLPIATAAAQAQPALVQDKSKP